MAIFIEAKKCLNVLGIYREKTNIAKTIYRRLLYLSILSNMVISLFWYVVFEAKSFTEYADPIFVLFSGATCILLYFMFLWQIDRFEELFDQFLAKIEERKYTQNCDFCLLGCVVSVMTNLHRY